MYTTTVILVMNRNVDRKICMREMDTVHWEETADHSQFLPTFLYQENKIWHIMSYSENQLFLYIEIAMVILKIPIHHSAHI